MDALTAQSIRGLRGRLESFRPRGLVPALMAEFRSDAPDEERRPLAAFEKALFSASLYQMGDGAEASRTTWLAGDPTLIGEFRNFCTDAARAALPAIHAAGYAVGIGAPNPRESWLWAMFELAALRLPGTYLRLADNDVLRACAPEITITEGQLSRDPMSQWAAAAGQTRYWRLASAVEASVAVLDLAESVMSSPAPAAPESSPAKGRPDRPRNTRAIDVDHYLGKLEASLRKRVEAELGQSETAVMEAMIRELYSLSAEDLVQPLRKFGYRGSAKTISRRSAKYRSWRRYRRGGAAPSTVSDPTQPAGRKVAPTHNAARVKDAVDSGGLSLRAGGRGTTRVRKTAAERAADRDADQFAREAGIDLPAAE